MTDSNASMARSYPASETQIPLSPDMVLQEARELQRHMLKEEKPYSAGVVADCIATIESLLSRAHVQSAPVFKATQNTAESDPVATQDCAGADTIAGIKDLICDGFEEGISLDEIANNISLLFITPQPLTVAQQTGNCGAVADGIEANAVLGDESPPVLGLLAQSWKLNKRQKWYLAETIANAIGYTLTEDAEEGSEVSSTHSRCAKCHCETKGEAALVDGKIWCHPCADSVPSTSRCTCAAIVNPNIPHARTCPLSSTGSGGAT